MSTCTEWESPVTAINQFQPTGSKCTIQSRRILRIKYSEAVGIRLGFVAQKYFLSCCEIKITFESWPRSFQGSVIFLFWFGFLPAKWNRKSEHIKSCLLTFCNTKLHVIGSFYPHMTFNNGGLTILTGHIFRKNPNSPNNGIRQVTSLRTPEALALTLFQTIKRIFTQLRTKGGAHNARHDSITWEASRAGQYFHIRPEFPCGSPSVMRLDNITLMHFNIYHYGLIVLQPLSVKHTKKKNGGSMCISSSYVWIPYSRNLPASTAGNLKGKKGVVKCFYSHLFSQSSGKTNWSQSMFIIYTSTCQCFSQRPTAKHCLST